jgi:hypothetical protein
MQGDDQELNEGGYSERDIRDALKSEHLMAVVHAYSMDRFTMGLAKFLIDQRNDPTVLEVRRRIFSHAGTWGFSHLIHELAKRIRAGTIHVPATVAADFPGVYQATPPADLTLLHNSGLLVFKFSDFEGMSRDESPFTVWRDTFTEEDLQALIKDRRFLAGIDAMAKGIVGWGTVRDQIMGGANHGPRDLSAIGLTRLGFEVYDRVQSVAIQVPPELRQEFPEAYQPVPPAPTED